jgi:hypothetical protein
MISYFKERIFLGIYILGMLFTMKDSPVWYISPPLIGVFLSILYISKKRSEQNIVLLLCGEFSSLVAWYASSWLAWVIQCTVIGLFLMRLDFPDNRKEQISLLALFGVLGVSIILIDQINHTLFPAMMILVASVVVVLSMYLSEFRLQREYIGEK